MDHERMIEQELVLGSEMLAQVKADAAKALQAKQDELAASSQELLTLQGQFMALKSQLEEQGEQLHNQGLREREALASKKDLEKEEALNEQYKRLQARLAEAKEERKKAEAKKDAALQAHVEHEESLEDDLLALQKKYMALQLDKEAREKELQAKFATDQEVDPNLRIAESP